MKVLITDPISDEGKQILTDAGMEDAAGEKSSSKLDLSNIEGWIVRSGTTITAKNIEQAENLRVIGRAGVGVDNIDIHAATMNGVLVMNTPDSNTISAAEHTVALLLTLALAFGVFEGLVAASPIAPISLVSPLSREIRLAGEGRFLGGCADEESAGDKER